LSLQILGRTGLRVSPLSLGTVELGMDYGLRVPGAYGQPSEHETIRIVHAALAGGINLIDTARSYGTSEAILGRALRDRRNDVVLATKTGTSDSTGTPLSGTALKRHMLDNLDASLEHLQTDWIDLWQIHQVDAEFLAQVEIAAEVFDAAKQAGKVRAIGGSTYGSTLPIQALNTNLFDTLQVGYSVLDQRLEDRFLPLAAQSNVGILARSVLLQGVLTERGDYLPERLADLRERSQQFRRLVANAQLGLSPAQAALAFALAQTRIGTVLVGVRTLVEVEENLHATQVTLPDELITAFRRLRLDDPELLDPRWWEQFLLDKILTKNEPTSP